MHTVYNILNLADGKYYFGQTKNSVEYRLRQHFYDARSTKRPICMPLHRAMREQPATNFVIFPLVECSTVEEANRREKLFIITLQATNPELGYNLAPGGNGHLHHAPRFSKEVRQRMSASAKERCTRNRKTHCSKGHLLTKENTITRHHAYGPYRGCRLCIQALEEKRNIARRPHAGIGRGGLNKTKTHCKRGHEFTLGNTIPVNNGRGRKCRTCEQSGRKINRKVGN